MIDVSLLNIFEIQSLRGFILKLFLIFDDVINKKAFEFGKISIPLSELPRVIVILMERLSFSKLFTPGSESFFSLFSLSGTIKSVCWKKDLLGVAFFWARKIGKAYGDGWFLFKTPAFSILLSVSSRLSLAAPTAGYGEKRFVDGKLGRGNESWQ